MVNGRTIISAGMRFLGFKHLQKNCCRNTLKGNLGETSCRNGLDNISSEEIPYKDGFANCIDVVTSGKHHVTLGDVHVFIPMDNLSGHVRSDFSLEIINNDSYSPAVNSTQMICSPIVQIKPHGAKFYPEDPAIIFLPTTSSPDKNAAITCLCSNTSIDEDPRWEQLIPNQYEVVGGNVVKLKTTHFSFYTAVVNACYPEASKMIFAGVGGTLEIPEVPGVKVTFPGSAMKYDIHATVKVMYADGPYDIDHDDPTSCALAAPVVKLGPTGHEFNPDSIEPVEVQLPLPHGKEIKENCGRPHLTFWQSSTAEGQLLEWKPFAPNYRIFESPDHHLYVSFPVKHFTFFKVLWSVLDSAIHEAKIGASFFYPNFEFCVSFQAFMSEHSGDESFGLCCLCYKKDMEAESIGNYPVFVGSSGLRMVKSGLLQIRIVSNLFEGNADFGEETLTQREFFTGRPFNKQFACKFVCPRTPEMNTVGKIFIERVLDNSEVEILFDFVLTKPPSSQARTQSSNNGLNRTHAVVNQQMNWESQLSQELANILSIKSEQDLGDGVWEDIARALGYTSLEIDMKFKDQDDPFTKLRDDYKKRGGNANDFIAAMYSVGRSANVNSFGSVERRLLDELPSSSQRNVEDDMIGYAGSISPSRTSSSSGVVLPTSPSNNRKRRHTDVPEGPIPNAKLDEVAKRVQEKWKKLGRTLELREDQLTEIEHDFKNGGIQEQAYQMLRIWQESYPDKGYESLIQGLGKLGYNTVARELYSTS
ncbi:uncharacterized protein LOC114519360 [Dendronephthya gigantea]|uniref:uncharacterized protein LOC114519360 n=1 Tax=Dendronephthya gigantea TaxID=151771 RepID=UPI00106D1B8D|nr:uncharacterized protein LOC114519360 [Dendronephthya gigantea]